MRRSRLATALLALALAGCTGIGGYGDYGSYYSLVRAKETAVGDGTMFVTPKREWSRERRMLFDDVKWVEDWTLNGPYLDDLTFVSGLPDNKYLVHTDTFEAQQIPRFHSDMTAPDVQALLESAYRVRGGAVDFRTISLSPRLFLGQPGFQLDYEHLDSDELWRRGRAVGAVIDGRLYLVMLDAARSHYFEAALPDFEAVTASARIAR